MLVIVESGSVPVLDARFGPACFASKTEAKLPWLTGAPVYGFTVPDTDMPSVSDILMAAHRHFYAVEDSCLATAFRAKAAKSPWLQSH